jgi:hypothetical protein
MTRSISTRIAGACGLCLAVGLFSVPQAAAQFGGFGFNRAVGGVAVDSQGVVEAPTVEDAQTLAALRTQTQLNVPTALTKFADRRAVSLKQLEAVVARYRAEKRRELPEEVAYLAGLQRVQYVFIYPEQHDVVLVGPAEGWKIDDLGNVVGQTTNRPVLLLDDLMVALRSGASSRVDPITCSIDPTAAGLQRLQELVSRLANIGNPDETLAMIEQALGPQMISVTGVPGSSHFARTMVAADFRMKRLAMDLERAPVDGMPSFMSMISGSGRGMSNTMPRWWLAPNYEPLAKTADGLAWELRGPGVKCMTEEDYVSETGEKRHTGKASPAAAKWAQTMTDKFDDLAAHDSSFGHLRNIMDLAVIGALMEKEQLAAAAGLDAPWLMGREAVNRYPVPTQTSSKASVVKKRGAWVISASGGVEMAPWHVADRTETVEAVGQARATMTAEGDNFWRE